jgi:hypothetical protein
MPTVRCSLDRERWDEVIGDQAHIIVGQKFEVVPGWKTLILSIDEADCGLIVISMQLPQYYFGLFKMLE